MEQNKISFNELEIINTCSSLLSSYGNCEIVYISAGLAPYSNSQKPDIVFKPNTLSEIIFIEYKICKKIKDVNLFQESKEFIQDSLGKVKMKYLFATNMKIDDSKKIDLNKMGIIILDSVLDADSLKKGVLEILNINSL